MADTSSSLYAGALPPALRDILPDALTVEGLGQEIAVLRIKAHHCLTTGDDAQLLRVLTLLGRLVVAQARLSAASDPLQDLLGSLADSVLGDEAARS